MKIAKLMFKEVTYGVRRSVCWLLGHTWIVIKSEVVPARSMNKDYNSTNIGDVWENEVDLYCPQCRNRETIYLPI
ncbi:hypothetical protein LCGC14_0503730 [marine sediment metagenome]|uniref:Uncharacterized protein n=1 Tax=marine sediment metagenome TaxID=412755 RepID=A0A0F9S354_9ZZZZ